MKLNLSPGVPQEANRRRAGGLLGLPILPITLPLPIPSIPILAPVVTLLLAGSTDVPLPPLLQPAPVPPPPPLPAQPIPAPATTPPAPATVPAAPAQPTPPPFNPSPPASEPQAAPSPPKEDTTSVVNAVIHDPSPSSQTGGSVQNLSHPNEIHAPNPSSNPSTPSPNSFKPSSSGEDAVKSAGVAANLAADDGKPIPTDFDVGDVLPTVHADELIPIVTAVDGHLTTIFSSKTLNGGATGTTSGAGTTDSPISRDPSPEREAASKRFDAVIISMSILAAILMALAIFLLRRRVRARRNRNMRLWWLGRRRTSRNYEDLTPMSSPRRSNSSWSSFGSPLDRSVTPSPTPFDHREFTIPPPPAMVDVSRSRVTVRTPIADRSLTSLQDTSSITSSSNCYFTASESPSPSGMLLAPIDEDLSASSFVTTPSFNSIPYSITVPSPSRYSHSQIEIPSSYFRLSKVPIPPIPPLPKSPPPIPESNPFLDDIPFNDPFAR